MRRVSDQMQTDGIIITNKQTPAPGALLNDPYEPAIISPVIHEGRVTERTAGPDVNAVPMPKGGPHPHRILVGQSAAFAGLF